MTNIGIDLIAVPLTQLFSYIVVGRILAAAAVLLAPVGGMLLWRVLHGQFHWWQISFAVLAWSTGLLMGFMNFQIGIGLALVAAAADPALRRHGTAVSLAVRVAIASVLLLMHFFALIFYFFLLCGLAIGSDVRIMRQRGALLQIGRSILLIAVTLALPVLLMSAFAPTLPGRQFGATPHTALSDFRAGFALLVHNPIEKLRGAFFGIRSYTDWLDMLSLAVLTLPVLVSLALRRLVVHAGMLMVLIALLFCYLVVPANLVGASYIDVRFAAMAPLVLAASLRPELPLRVVGGLAPLLFAVALVRTGVVAWVWHDRQADIAAVARALEPVPPGAAILPLEHQFRTISSGPPMKARTMGGRYYRSLVTLALPWRQAFVPVLFTVRGLQPVKVLPPWDEIAEPEAGFLPSVNALLNPELYSIDLQFASYLSAWKTRFDFALVVNADLPDDNGPFVPPAGMELVRDEGFAQLYRFNHLAPLSNATR